MERIYVDAWNGKVLPDCSNLDTPILTYRVTMVVADLSWVDLDLGCPTILLGQ